MKDRAKATGNGGLARAALLLVGLVLFAIGAAYLMVKAWGGSDLVEVTAGPSNGVDIVRTHKDALLWTLLATGGGAILAAAALWSLLHARALEGDEVEHRRMSEQLEKAKKALAESEQKRSAVEKARELEREWNRKLRSQISTLQRSHGPLGQTGDLPDLILRTAIELLDAEKGIMIAGDPAADGSALSVRASHGFVNDPSDSAIAKRYASEVLDKDQTIRHSAADLEGEEAGPADAEIENLVAIPIYVQDEFSGAVICANSEGYQDHEEEVLLALGDHAGAALENSALHGQLRTSYLATVKLLTEAIEVKDPLLRGHSEEVFGYVSRVAEKLGIEPSAREQLLFASLLHDVGKIGISERILLKPGPLTPEEFGIIQLHPRIGSRLINNVPLLRPMAGAILHHHERFDGDGYPGGLRGEQIPIEARLIGVADAYSAMTSDRPYRGRMSLEEACKELERCAGSQFDPVVVETFVGEVRADERPEEIDSAAFLDDPELLARWDEDEPILGAGSYAVVDNLTLLYSHRYLHEIASSEAKRSTLQEGTFAVCLVQLARLDQINRQESYLLGDRALQSLARAVQSEAVRCGGTACRFSGDTIALLVPGGGADVAEAAVDRITASLGAETEVRCATAACIPGEDGEAVIDRARSQLALAGESPIDPEA